MSQDLLIIISVIAIGFASLIFFLNKKLSSPSSKTDEALMEWLKTMQSTINSSSSQTVKTLQENSKQLNERLDNAARVIRDVEREVGQMSEIGRNMKDLQDLLKSPKLRGNIGEHVLKDLISQVFPKNSFNLQYEFRSGEKVDAAIKTDAGILPIDSKFPMENFKKMAGSKDEKEQQSFEKEFVKDVKRHIDSISKKYILPAEGTMDFALMYIPSEAVYYEIANQSDLMEYSRNCRIYPVSPSTLYASLQTILLSFEGKKMEQKSRQILTTIRAIQIDYNKVSDNMSVLGKHINNTYTQYGNVSSGFMNLGQKLNYTKTLEEEEQMLIDKEKKN